MHGEINILSVLTTRRPCSQPGEKGECWGEECQSPVLTSGAGEGLHGASSATRCASRAGQAGAGPGHGAEGARLTGQLQPRACRAVGAAGTSVPMDPIRGAGRGVSFQANIAGERERERENPPGTSDPRASPGKCSLVQLFQQLPPHFVP